MSDSHGSAAHGHEHGGPDHVPHVTPMKIYLMTFSALVVLTFLTVAISRVNLGHSTNLVIALFIATVKATTVAAMFMHLYADHRFHTMIFASSVVFLLVFVTFTMFDTEFRGKFGSIDGVRVQNMQDPFNKLPPPTPSASASAAPAAEKK